MRLVNWRNGSLLSRKMRNEELPKMVKMVKIKTALNPSKLKMLMVRSTGEVATSLSPSKTRCCSRDHNYFLSLTASVNWMMTVSTSTRLIMTIRKTITLRRRLSRTTLRSRTREKRSTMRDRCSASVI